MVYTYDNLLFGKKITAPLFGSTDNQNTFGIPPKSTQNTFGIPPKSTQNTFEIPSQIDQNYKILNDKIDILSTQVEKLIQSSNDKIYVACIHHEHLLYETTSDKIYDKRGFKCDVCNLIFKPNVFMYHCKDCEKKNIQFDLCEHCIRKTLKT
jgi:hypothetical protein